MVSNTVLKQYYTYCLPMKQHFNNVTRKPNTNRVDELHMSTKFNESTLITCSIDKGFDKLMLHKFVHMLPSFYMSYQF